MLLRVASASLVPLLLVASCCVKHDVFAATAAADSGKEAAAALLPQLQQQQQLLHDTSLAAIEEATTGRLASPRRPELLKVVKTAGSEVSVFVAQHRTLSIALFVGLIILAWSLKLNREMVRT